MQAKTPIRVPNLRPGAVYQNAPIEAAATMHALVYFGKGDVRVVPDRPIVCTATDVVVRVELVHRCGTDVKIYFSGRPDQIEESLLEELAGLFGISGSGQGGRLAGGRDYHPEHFLDYLRLVEHGAVRDNLQEPLYRRLVPQCRDLSEDERGFVHDALLHFWGRIIGHETVATIVRVGSKVGQLRQGIGYCQGRRLTDEYLAFEPGQRVTIQSRVARYQPPATDRPGARGIQLLGGNITDVAMNLGGEFAQYCRLTSEVIRSGSILRLPEGVDNVQAALVEPTACVLDCFQKTTHELGQDDCGSILKKGVFPGGNCVIIGSGSMAMLCGKMALSRDPIINCGGTGQVLFVVRSRAKADLVQRIMDHPRVSIAICPRDHDLRKVCLDTFDGGPDFRGFDDVIVAAGTAETLRFAHDLIAPTGARVMAFAGTRGPATFESGTWHYANAGVLGTSGSNTKMMEVALGMIQRGSLDVRPLSGKRYSFAELAQEGGVASFFADHHLRPALAPNQGLAPCIEIEQG